MRIVTASAAVVLVACGSGSAITGTGAGASDGGSVDGGGANGGAFPLVPGDGGSGAALAPIAMNCSGAARIR